MSQTTWETNNPSLVKRVKGVFRRSLRHNSMCSSKSQLMQENSTLTVEERVRQYQQGKNLNNASFNSKSKTLALRSPAPGDADYDPDLDAELESAGAPTKRGYRDSLEVEEVAQMNFGPSFLAQRTSQSEIASAGPASQAEEKNNKKAKELLKESNGQRLNSAGKQGLGLRLPAPAPKKEKGREESVQQLALRIEQEAYAEGLISEDELSVAPERKVVQQKERKIVNGKPRQVSKNNNVNNMERGLSYASIPDLEKKLQEKEIQRWKEIDEQKAKTQRANSVGSDSSEEMRLLRQTAEESAALKSKLNGNNASHKNTKRASAQRPHPQRQSAQRTNVNGNPTPNQRSSAQRSSAQRNMSSGQRLAPARATPTNDDEALPTVAMLASGAGKKSTFNNKDLTL